MNVLFILTFSFSCYEFLLWVFFVDLLIINFWKNSRSILKEYCSWSKTGMYYIFTIVIQIFFSSSIVNLSISYCIFNSSGLIYFDIISCIKIHDMSWETVLHQYKIHLFLPFNAFIAWILLCINPTVFNLLGSDLLFSILLFSTFSCHFRCLLKKKKIAKFEALHVHINPTWEFDFSTEKFNSSFLLSIHRLITATHPPLIFLTWVLFLLKLCMYRV